MQTIMLTEKSRIQKYTNGVIPTIFKANTWIEERPKRDIPAMLRSRTGYIISRTRCKMKL